MLNLLKQLCCYLSSLECNSNREERCSVLVLIYITFIFLPPLLFHCNLLKEKENDSSFIKKDVSPEKHAHGNAEYGSSSTRGRYGGGG